jgi:hypothetical protein
VTLGERLDEIFDSLLEGWSEVLVLVTIADSSQADRAALILASCTPGRSGASFRLTISRAGVGGPSPDAARRGLERLDAEGIDARLSLPGTAAFQMLGPRPAPAAASPRLAGAWDDAVAALPPDWSDLQAEATIASSADVERAALLLGPVNPFLHDGVPPAFRFRVARRFGYGAAPQVARRVLERLDEAGIVGSLRVLRVQSDTSPVLTQGPVWREDGRAV